MTLNHPGRNGQAVIAEIHLSENNEPIVFKRVLFPNNTSMYAINEKETDVNSYIAKLRYLRVFGIPIMH